MRTARGTEGGAYMVHPQEIDFLFLHVLFCWNGFESSETRMLILILQPEKRAADISLNLQFVFLCLD